MWFGYIHTVNFPPWFFRLNAKNKKMLVPVNFCFLRSYFMNKIISNIEHLKQGWPSSLKSLLKMGILWFDFWWPVLSFLPILICLIQAKFSDKNCQHQNINSFIASFTSVNNIVCCQNGALLLFLFFFKFLTPTQFKNYGTVLWRQFFCHSIFYTFLFFAFLPGIENRDRMKKKSYIAIYLFL